MNPRRLASRLIPPLLLAPALLLVAACAGSGTFPSLAQRPVERNLPPPEVEPTSPVIADDPALAARIAELVAEARRGQAGFAAALAPAQVAVRRAGAPESASWAEAQEAVSRAEAAEEPTTRALAALDAYSVGAAAAKPLSEADLAALQAAVADVQRLADAQHEAVARLQATLRTP